MTAIDSIKQELFRGIEKLPATQLPEVLQFVNDLLSSQNQNFYQSPADVERSPQSLVGDRDPLSEFIGAVEHGSLAQNIDAEIYET